MACLKFTGRFGKNLRVRVFGELLLRMQTVADAKGCTNLVGQPDVASLAQAYLLIGLERDEQELRELAAMKRFRDLGPNARYWRKDITGQKSPCVKLAVEHDGWNSVYLPGGVFAGESCVTPLEELVEIIPYA